MTKPESDERIKELEGENKALRVALAVKEQRRKDREQEWVAEANRLTRERDEARAERDRLADMLRTLTADRDYRMLDRNLERADELLAALPKEDDRE